MSEGFLKRYTELPYLLYALRTRQLTLMNPAAWEDRNDAHFLMTYRQRQDCGSVLALCFTRASETYHHWKVFSSGSSGVCIDFDLQGFSHWAGGICKAKFEDVHYLKLDRIRRDVPDVNKLPFVKRYAFRDELEWRLIYEASEPGLHTKNIKFDIATISRIVLSPWLPKAVAREIKKVIRGIDGCSKIKVIRTTLIDNAEWQKHGDGGV